MTRVHVVVPEGIDDPARPSGGNALRPPGLRRARRRRLDGARARRARRLAAARRGVARGARRRRRRGSPTAPSCCSTGSSPRRPPRSSSRRRAGCGWSRSCTCRWAGGTPTATPGSGERAVLCGRHGRRDDQRLDPARLLELYALPADRVHVAEPGVDAADLAPGTPAGGALLCVAAVIPAQGPRRAARRARDAGGPSLALRCASAASTATRPSPTGLRRRAADAGLDDRVRFAGPQTGADLDRSYAAADLLVLASRGETYGMVVTEALARGLPVVATEVGGVPEALGTAPTAPARGCWCRPATRRRSRAALRAWLGDPACAGACAGPRASGARRSPAGRRPRRSSPTSWRGRRGDRRGHPRQPRLARPARGRRRRCPLPGARRAAPSPSPATAAW